MSYIDNKAQGPGCITPIEADYTGVTIIELAPDPPMQDYLQAMELANRIADEQLGDQMLLSWYDRDRDFAHTIQIHHVELARRKPVCGPYPGIGEPQTQGEYRRRLL